jgi:hypothetical protein
MTIEEQLREYRATLDAATGTAAASQSDHSAPPVRMRPARSFVFAAVAVAAAIAFAFAAVGVSHKRSTPPAGHGASTSVSPPTTIAPPSRTVVPDVVGRNTPVAVSMLETFGFHATKTSTTECVAGPGLVIAQVPGPGTHVAPATKVTIEVCNHRSAQYATVPVVVCPTEYGVPPTASDPHAPTSLTIVSPAFDRPKLSGYSDRRGFLPVVGPAGWNCKAIEAGDGGQGIGVTPPGVAPRDSWVNAVPPKLPPADGVFASWEPGCQGCVYGEICGIVPSADADFPSFARSGICNAQPVGQQVTPLGGDLYAIDDPAGTIGPDAAHSILRYTRATSTSNAMALRITCILPASQRNVCDSLIDEFLKLHA